MKYVIGPFAIRARSVSRVLNYKILQKETVLAPVVQTLDSALHRINHYPADKYLGNQSHYPLDRDLSSG